MLIKLDMDTFSQSDVEKLTQETVNHLRDVAFDFFGFQPLNKTIIDTYNDMIAYTIPEILDVPVFYETENKVGMIEFKHVTPMPPFNGPINPPTADEKLTDLKKIHKDQIQQLENKYAFGSENEDYDITRLETNEAQADLAILRKKQNDERHKLLFEYYSEVPKEKWLTAASARQTGKHYLLSIYVDIHLTEWDKREDLEVKILEEFETDENGKNADILDRKILRNKVSNNGILLDTKTSYEKTHVLLFELPLMLGSAWDWLILAGVPKQKWNLYGECDLSPQCQFIINGNEKAFVSQIKASSNEPRILLDTKTADKIPEKVCEWRCATISKKSNLIRFRFASTSGRSDIEGVKICFMTMPFMKDEQIVRGSSAKPKLTFNVLWIFRFYAIWYYRTVLRVDLEEGESNNIMLQEFNKTLLDVCHQQNAKSSEISLYRRVVNELIDTIEHAVKFDQVNIKSDKDFISHLRDYTKVEHTGDIDHNLNHMKYWIDAQFMPQIVCLDYTHRSPFDWSPYPKFTALVQALVKYVKCYVGVKTIDDRDSLEEQQLATAGMEIGVLVKKAFNGVKNMVKNSIKTNKGAEVSQIAGFFHSFGSSKVTDQIVSSFSTGNWGLAGGGPPRAGVVQMFETASLLSQWNMVRKTSIPAKKNSNIEKPRRVHHTSYGIYDPTNTPDSEAVGLNRSICLSVYITNDDMSSYAVIVNHLIDAEGDGVYKKRKPEEGEDVAERFPCYIDNVFFCYATEKIYNEIKKMKLEKQLGYSEVYIRTVVDNWETVREIRIRTCAGRTMRPLLRVIDKTIPALELKRNGEEASFFTLWNMGFAEYVSPGEFQEAEVAMNYQHFMRGLAAGRKFTHIELDPYMAMSVEVATQPYPQLNPNPRVLYYASMSRQPLSVPFATYQTRQETETRVLNYVHKPLITTDIVKILGLDQQPFGAMVYVAVLSKASTDEDATVWKKSFFDRGGMQGTIYNTYSVEAAATVADPKDPVNSYSKGLIRVRYPAPSTEAEDKENAEEEPEWPFPEDFPTLKGQTNVVVQPDTILARYRVKQDEMSEIGKLKLAGKRSGFVSFTDYSGSGVQREQRIVVRFPHIPKEGDKFANRYAQKGVVGNVVPDVDMPYILTPTGSITPDVIFSPTSLTSRMTVGMNAEIWAGQAMVACDMRRIVKNLVRWTMGMQQPELADPNKDFWIILDDVLIQSEKSFGQKTSASFQTFSRIRKDLAKTTSPEELEEAFETRVNEMIDSEEWEQKLGILVSKDVGTEYLAIPDENSVSTLGTGENAILFSQLNPELAELWFIENSDKLIPTYMFRNPQNFPQEDVKDLEDATAFRDPNFKAIYQALKDRGYSPKGQYAMVNGKTGIMSKATIFAGPCMWMQLRHLTDSKYQIRDGGSMSVATRGVAKGKAVGGAVRSGELSHSAMLAHGNMAYLAERFMLASDKYEALVCKNCGGECYKQANSAVIKCETCGGTDIPRILTMPYSGVRFMSLLSSAGVRPKLETIEDPRHKHNVITTTVFGEEFKSNEPRQFIL